MTSSTHPPALTAARVVCTYHPAFASDDGSAAAEAISVFLVAPVSQAAVTYAATLGSVRLLQRLMYQVQRIQDTNVFLPEHWLTRAAKTAAEYGHREFVWRVLRYGSESVPSFWPRSAEATLEGAIAGGRLVLIQIMMAAMGDDRSCAVLRTARVPAVCKVVIQWLQSRPMPITLQYDFQQIPPGFSEATVLRGLEWLLSNPDWGERSQIAVGLKQLLNAACARAYGQVVRCIFEHCGTSMGGERNQLIVTCGLNPSTAHRALFQYLLRCQPQIPSYEPCILTRFIEAGTIESAEILLERWPELWLEETRRGYRCRLLVSAFGSGSRHVMRWVQRYHCQHYPSAKPLYTSASLLKASTGKWHHEMEEWWLNHSRTKAANLAMDARTNSRAFAALDRIELPQLLEWMENHAGPWLDCQIADRNARAHIVEATVDNRFGGHSNILRTGRWP